jgi:hypothetical protein
MKRTLTAWLAIFGMVLNALWPLLAHAVPAEFSAPVCSTVGTRSAPSDANGGPAQPAPAKSPAAHCPFCAGGGDQNPVLATAASPAIAAPTMAARPFVAPASSVQSVVLLAAQPRGPPARLI